MFVVFWDATFPRLPVTFCLSCLTIGSSDRLYSTSNSLKTSNKMGFDGLPSENYKISFKTFATQLQLAQNTITPLNFRVNFEYSRALRLFSIYSPIWLLSNEHVWSSVIPIDVCILNIRSTNWLALPSTQCFPFNFNAFLISVYLNFVFVWISLHHCGYECVFACLSLCLVHSSNVRFFLFCMEFRLH